MKHILAAIDFSEHADHVLKTAASLAVALHCRLTLLHVAAPNPDFVGYTIGPQTVRDARAAELSNERAMIHKSVSNLQTLGIECHGMLVSGATVQTIVQEANRFQCELIVIGTFGHNAFVRAVAGSVVSGVLLKAPCPVVVVPVHPAKV